MTLFTVYPTLYAATFRHARDTRDHTIQLSSNPYHKINNFSIYHINIKLNVSQWSEAISVCSSKGSFLSKFLPKLGTWHLESKEIFKVGLSDESFLSRNFDPNLVQIILS